MTPELVPLEAWTNVPFPPLVDRFPDYDAAGKTFALDVTDAKRTLGALISLDTAADDSSNGVRVVEADPARLRYQIDQATLAAAYAACLAAGLMRAGEDAVLVYDLRVTHADGFVEVWTAGSFTIHAGKTLQ